MIAEHYDDPAAELDALHAEAEELAALARAEFAAGRIVAADSLRKRATARIRKAARLRAHTEGML